MTQDNIEIPTLRSDLETHGIAHRVYISSKHHEGKPYNYYIYAFSSGGEILVLPFDWKSDVIRIYDNTLSLKEHLDDLRIPNFLARLWLPHYGNIRRKLSDETIPFLKSEEQER
jgi:hypothetical protein